MAKVTRQNKLNKAKLENAVKRGLILSGMLVAQRATGKAHVVTGRLKRSITHSQPEQTGPMMWKIDVGTNVSYAREEEFRPGTKDGTSHSYLRPALEESRDDIKDIMVKSTKAGV